MKTTTLSAHTLTTIGCRYESSEGEAYPLTTLAPLPTQWWMSGSPTQDIEATAEHITAQEPHVIVLVDGEHEVGASRPWRVLGRAPSTGFLRGVLNRVFGEPSCPGWRLVVETEDRRGVRTCFVHLYLYHQHPFTTEGTTP